MPINELFEDIDIETIGLEEEEVFNSFETPVLPG